MIRNRLLSAIALALIATTAIGDELLERDWRLLTSENFRVHTVLSDDRTTELLRQLEVMRSALGDANGIATYQAQVPTVIIALDKEADYKAIGAPEPTVGIFFADQRENAIIVQDNNEVQGVPTILHEYVHYLQRQNGRSVYPRWYAEGNAEYLSSSRVTDIAYESGLPIKRRMSSLAFSAWLPMTDVLELSDISSLSREQGDLFYSQSWLLVHYLNNQPDTGQDIADKLQRYGELMVGGSGRIEAFEKAFSIQADKLDQLLLQYFLADDFQVRSIPVSTSLADFSPTVETLAVAQVQIALAEMAMRFQNVDAAQEWFTQALSNEETKPRAEAGLGTVFGYRGEIAKANARFEAAIYLVSYDFRMWMDYAQFWAARVSDSRYSDKRVLYAKRLEEALRNALTISDATPELNSLMGFAYLAQNKDLEDAIEFLLAATEQSPTDQGSRLLLANAYHYSGEYHLAIEAAESVLSLEHESSVFTTSAQDIIANASRALDWQQ